MKRLPYVILALLVIGLDIYTKLLIIRNVRLHSAIPVIENLFQIVHVRNTGAAFGIGAGSSSPIVPLILNGGAIIVFFIVVVYSLRTQIEDRLLQVGLHLILGGAVGNLIDRFRWGSVVDFLDVYVTIGGREHHWPAFNVADSAICVGMVLLFIDMWRKPKEAAKTELRA